MRRGVPYRCMGVMKPVCVLRGLLLSALMLSTAAAAEMTGWISDSACGKANASSKASARECAQRCIREGASPVFVSEKDQKVYKVQDAALAKQHLKGKVMVSGTLHGDVLQIAKIEDLPE